MSGPKQQPAANDTVDFWIQYLVDEHICSSLSMLRRDIMVIEDEDEQIKCARDLLGLELKYAKKLASTVKELLADLDKDQAAFVRANLH